MLICLSSTAVFLKSWVGVAGILVLSVLILLLGKVKIGRMLAQVKGILTLLLSLFVLQCLFNRAGDPLLVIGGWTIVTTEGVMTSVLVTLRLFTILLCALLVLTGEPRDYLLAMTQCKIPYELAFMVMAALRFVPLLREEARDVVCAVQMRGTKLKKAKLRQKAKTYIRILIPIVAGAIQRAEQMSIAMQARGFGAQPKRTSMRRLTLCKRDYILLAVFAVAFAGVVVAGCMLQG